MKKLSIVLSLLMVATISFAQAPGGQGFPGGGQMNFNPEDMAKRQAERLQQQLELNKTQYDSLYVFFLAQSKEQQKQREQMRQGGQQPQQMDREAMMERFQKQREAQEAKLKTILTEAQFKKYQEQQAQQRANFGGGQGFPGGGQGGFQGGMPPRQGGAR